MVFRKILSLTQLNPLNFSGLVGGMSGKSRSELKQEISSKCKEKQKIYEQRRAQAPHF